MMSSFSRSVLVVAALSMAVVPSAAVAKKDDRGKGKPGQQQSQKKRPQIAAGTFASEPASTRGVSFAVADDGTVSGLRFTSKCASDEVNAAIADLTTKVRHRRVMVMRSVKAGESRIRVQVNLKFTSADRAVGVVKLTAGECKDRARRVTVTRSVEVPPVTDPAPVPPTTDPAPAPPTTDPVAPQDS